MGNNFKIERIGQQRLKKFINKNIDTEKTLEGYSFITAKTLDDLTDEFIKEHLITIEKQ